MIDKSNLEKELKTSFIDYSMSVIISRALPDIRDGLKPVHRRILYAMYELKNFYNRPYLKSARIVGDVIGKYHPHGDSSVYEALVRMAQDFSLRYTLINGQGNFGSVDGDPPAAMRYTESRMSFISELMLSDIEMDTVNFVPNYDNKEYEPAVLPARLPQLLVNGVSGIAVGMATSIAPHNIGEVIDGILAFIDDEDISIENLMNYIKGPDFPTGANIIGLSSIQNAYKSGRGSVIVQSTTEIEKFKNETREKIIVKELPYQVNKARLIEKIADLVKDKKIDGISDLRDESAKNEIRIVIEIKRGESANIILNNLYKLTPLQSSFSFNMVALVNGVPKSLSLIDLIKEFLNHRKEVVTRKTAFQLKKTKERNHILQGLKTTVENLNEIINIIRSSKDSQIAEKSLIASYDLTNIQAKAILDMRLARITGLERDKIVKEYEQTLKKIKELEDILSDKKRITEIIIDELKEIKEKHQDDRKTNIIADSYTDFDQKSLIADDDVLVNVSYDGYVKRSLLSSIDAQKRGGKGKSATITKEKDFIKQLFNTTNHCSLLCFSNIGKVYKIMVYEIPEKPLKSKGVHFSNLINIAKGERIVSVLSVKDFIPNNYIISATSDGYIKKTEIMSYSHIRQTGIRALILNQGDNLISCAISSGENEILLATKLGKAIRFSEKDVRSTGRASRGVIGIKMNESDQTVGMEIISGEASILSICKNGYGKRTSLSEYPLRSRAGKGIITIKVSKRNGPVIGIAQIKEDEELLIMSYNGKLVRFKISEMNIIGRATQGVRLMKIDGDDHIIDFSKIGKSSED